MIRTPALLTHINIARAPLREACERNEILRKTLRLHGMVCLEIDLLVEHLYHRYELELRPSTKS